MRIPHFTFQQKPLAQKDVLMHDGVFASNGAVANIFLRSSADYDRPDVQLTPMTVSNSAGMWFPGFTPPPVHCFTIRIGVMHPASRGWVKLRSTDPRGKVRIRFNMYQEAAARQPALTSTLNYSGLRPASLTAAT